MLLLPVCPARIEERDRLCTRQAKFGPRTRTNQHIELYALVQGNVRLSVKTGEQSECGRCWYGSSSSEPSRECAVILISPLSRSCYAQPRGDTKYEIHMRYHTHPTRVESSAKYFACIQIDYSTTKRMKNQTKSTRKARPEVPKPSVSAPPPIFLLSSDEALKIGRGCVISFVANGT